jgi:ubiquinone/menaquinone biosynthesis C-methylase UbiE
VNKLTDDATVVLAAIASYPSIRTLVEAQLSVWPEHARYLATRFRQDSVEAIENVDRLADLALRIIGSSTNEFCRDYQWMCANFNEEQYYFAKSGDYRIRTFAEAFAKIYDNPEYMRRYVHGILLSQIFWRNHFQAIEYFRAAFLPRNPIGARHLEVGPGHGLFLYLAAQDSRTGTLDGWDISKSSLAATQSCLSKFGIVDRVTLYECDVLNPKRRSDQFFDSILISEVLEHLEAPDLALRNLKEVLAPKGRILVNVPINSPAPDHIYLWKTPDAVNDTIRSVGLKVSAAEYYPVTGFTLAEAMRRHLSVSCVVTCEHA